MAKLILYQAKSPYPGDVTKNCALTGKEVDNNFLNLKGEDIEKIYLDEETKTLTFTRFKNGLKNCNGEPIDAEIEIDLTKLEYVTGYKYEDGVIKITYSNGKTAVMPVEAFGMAVATDSTISGNGTKGKPLSIAQDMRTGQYQSVYGVVDVAEGERLPKHAKIGEGYITREVKSDFGMFYTSDQALLLEGLLRMDNSEWRVPRKSDWDKLLNYLEECDKYKNHALRSETDIDARGMKLGNLAGFKAKSLDTDEFDYWTRCGRNNGNVLRMYPTGSFSALTGAYKGFGDHAHFWSLTEGDVSCRNFYSKKFIDCVGTVTQIEEMPAAKLTIRLVKDFIGDNYQQFEEIHGRTYETKLFASESEECNQVWTMVNIDIQDPEKDLIATPLPEDATTAVTIEYGYYINRWDGKKWAKHELVEGDCVVIIPEGNSDEMAEYRLENGELVNRDAFWQDQIDELYSAITESVEVLQGEIDELSGATQELRNDVDEISAATEALEEIVGEGLSGTTLTDAVIQLQEDLAEEVSARTEADEELWDAIEEEISARTAADEHLQEEIDEEVSARTAADEYLQEEIDDLNDRLEDEISARTAADQELQEEIDEINDKIGNVNDIPEKAAVEYTPEDFEEGRITVFGFINASNDYGYNLNE